MDEQLPLDEAIEQAWRAWEGALAYYVQGMAPGEQMMVEVRVGREPARGSAPWVQVLRDGSVVVACVASNGHLAEAYRLDASGHRRLAHWFRRPGTPMVQTTWPGAAETWTVEYAEPGAAEARALAERVVKALRRVFGVIDPALLLVSGQGDLEPLHGPAPVGSAAPKRFEAPAAQRAGTPDELGSLVRQSLSAWFQTDVKPDADGDFLYETLGCPIWVSTPTMAPMVVFEGIVLHAVADPAQADLLVTSLNKVVPATLRVDGDRVRLRYVLGAAPYDHEQLLSAMRLVKLTIEHATPKLVEAAGGLAPRESA